MIANAALPSQSSAYALVNGEPGALPRVASHLLGRAAIIGVGLYAAGDRGKIVRHALGAATAIEVFVLLWALYHKDAQ